MTAVQSPKTIYERMFSGEIPTHKIYEDTKNGFLAFLDIKPATVGHTLVVPKEPVDPIYDMEFARAAQMSRLTQIISQRRHAWSKRSIMMLWLHSPTSWPLLVKSRPKPKLICCG